MSNSNYFWTNMQTSLLQTSYSIGGLAEAQKALPEKKKGTIATKASRMQLTTPKPRKNK